MAKGGKRAGAGRPKGAISKATADIKALALDYAPQALETLAQIALGGESEAARVSAANSLLDRAYGKPKQAVDVEANVKATVTAVEWRVVRPSA